MILIAPFLAWVAREYWLKSEPWVVLLSKIFLNMSCLAISITINDFFHEKIIYNSTCLKVFRVHFTFHVVFVCD